MCAGSPPARENTPGLSSMAGGSSVRHHDEDLSDPAFAASPTAPGLDLLIRPLDAIRHGRINCTTAACFAPSGAPDVQRAQMPPGLSSIPGGVNWSRAPVNSEPPSMLRRESDCGGRLFTAKLAVVPALSAASTARRSTEAHAAAVRSAISGIRR
jgi:hypothetical protein